MTEYKGVDEAFASAWDALVTHPLQSWKWGEFRKNRQPISRIGKFENGELVKTFLIVWTKVPYTPFYFGYIPMGLLPDINDVKALKAEARNKNGLAIRMEPNILKGVDIYLPKGRNLFKPKTYIWNLTLTEEELLKRMHPKARYNIKVAAKHGVEVQEDMGAFENYLKLLFEGTVKRQKVGMHDENYHRQMVKNLGEAARLFVAKYRNEIVSAMLVFEFKNNAYYAYGANSLAHKEVMAGTQLVWEVAKKLKHLGIESFDFWGAEAGSGFSRFKEQFGAELVELAGTYDIVVNPVRYRLFRFIEEVRWKVKHQFN